MEESAQTFKALVLISDDPRRGCLPPWGPGRLGGGGSKPLAVPSSGWAAAPETVRLAVKLPLAVAARATRTSQEAEGARGPVQVLSMMVKSPASGPARAMPNADASLLPSLVRKTDWAGSGEEPPTMS